APAQAGPGLLEACFAPATLAAAPSERRPVKGIRRFDAPPPPRTLVPFAPVPPERRGAIRRVELPAGRKLIALTLDLCEQPGEVAGYDGAIIDYLRAHGIKATLFAGGKWMRSHPERTRQLMADPRFELANHAEAHRNLRLLAGAALAEEIAGPQRAYEAAREQLSQMQCVTGHEAELAHVPRRMGLFRFPFGACSAAALAAVNDAGLLAIQWDLSTGDPSPTQSAAAIAAAMVGNVRPGSIIIAHANGRGHNTAAALPIAIPKLRAAGYELVTVSELIAAGKPVIANTCYDSRPGDTDRYDRLFPSIAARPPSPKGWRTEIKP
ncbi:MAG: polysaccharide deacetylase family protein, partial [Pseudomonadota bacterium]